MLFKEIHLQIHTMQQVHLESDIVLCEVSQVSLLIVLDIDATVICPRYSRSKRIAGGVCIDLVQ